MNENPKNPLLGFLRTLPRAVGDAFRTNPRYASRRRARLSWQERGRTLNIKTRLIDISRMGAAVSAATPPPTATLVRLRLVGSSPTPWIEADVLGVEPNEGAYRVRLKFREPCPTILLKSAVLDERPASESESTEVEATD